MYNVILWKDNGDENFHVFKHKPTFDDLYKLIGCSLIEITKGYNPEVSQKSFEMYIDEEGNTEDVVGLLEDGNFGKAGSLAAIQTKELQ